MVSELVDFLQSEDSNQFKELDKAIKNGDFTDITGEIQYMLVQLFSVAKKPKKEALKSSPLRAAFDESDHEKTGVDEPTEISESESADSLAPETSSKSIEENEAVQPVVESIVSPASSSQESRPVSVSTVSIGKVSVAKSLKDIRTVEVFDASADLLAQEESASIMVDGNKSASLVWKMEGTGRWSQQ
jgi:hypothetical protein